MAFPLLAATSLVFQKPLLQGCAHLPLSVTRTLSGGCSVVVTGEWTPNLSSDRSCVIM
jgi:hypothetical protein